MKITKAFVAGAAALAVAGGLTLATAASAQAATPGCHGSQIVITHTLTDGATGHTSLVLLFRNNSRQTCSLRGYPGFDALSIAGHALAHAARTNYGFAGGAPVTTVTLKPNGIASAVAEWLNFNPVTSGACRTAVAIKTTAPNTGHTVRFAVRPTVCGLQIHPVVSGAPNWSHYARAQQFWLAGAHVSAARMGRYWHKAGVYLAMAKGEYTQQIAMLHELIGYPDTGLTHAQAVRVRTLTRELNSFFSAPATTYFQ